MRCTEESRSFLETPRLNLDVSEFSVKGPAEPINVLLGEDATLPCQLSPEQSAAQMHIRWYRVQLSPAVLVYQNGQEQGGEQMLEYRGRMELVGDSIHKGAVALLHVRASDNGQYQCHFEDGHMSQEAIVELHVTGLGSAPLVHMMGPEDGGIRVLCSSGGWFPKPGVQWSDTAGVKLPSFSESQTQDGDGLFHVEASLVVTDSSLGNVTCSIQNPLSGREKVSAIFLPEPFFPRTCPWKAALAGTLPVLGLLLIGISYTGWREHQAKEREVKKRKKESHEREQMRKEKEMALTAKANLKAELEWRKALYDEDWKKALLYPDWRKEQFQPVVVTLNHEIFHQNNSDPGRKENLRDGTQDLSLSNKQEDCNLITLNQENFTSGKHYWEMDVEDTEEWTLGIYEEPTEKIKDLQKKTFRVLEKKGCEYRALACCLQDISLEKTLLIEKCPQKIVIFLDYEDSDISFYNMTNGTHIFSFTQARFSGSLYPYFKFKSMEISSSSQY
ncbi:PREDICTED: butyrophilin-like protein 1 [Ceratotherium simum simum]|uniref:Butyrophilin-like protein 1 n=1 Tax=Ceratotherium simum simum TaxID=73337 RepID=A0ABM1CES6_CERSS|nr:PREDICTED: butyrophilin-like protein 1 [Ceratotherium simum simum]